MAKDKSLSKEERKAAKKAAKAVASAEEAAPTGITKSKSDKKEKKEKKSKLAEKAEAELAKVNGNVDAAGEVVSEEDDDDDGMQVTTSGVKEINGRPIGALVPFANPLADEKVGKKVFKSVKKAAATRTLKRGVKEVVKALRKSPSTGPSSSSSQPLGVVILAADISPMDVISHIPVLCEDHNIPYIYVTSRAELGMASQTKRPTSVVMVARDVAVGKQGKGGEKREGGESAEDWAETYKALAKVVEREGKSVKV